MQDICMDIIDSRIQALKDDIEKLRDELDYDAQYTPRLFGLPARIEAKQKELELLTKGMTLLPSRS
jgi:hypothetical protein